MTRKKDKPLLALLVAVARQILNDGATHFEVVPTSRELIGISNLRMKDDNGRESHLPTLLTLKLEPLLSLEHAAAEIGVTDRTLQRWVKDGAPVIYKKHGRRDFPLFPLEMLKEFARATRRKAAQQGRH
jgi:hypothetical protein